MNEHPLPDTPAAASEALSSGSSGHPVVRLTISVVTYNSEAWLPGLINSILSQALPTRHIQLLLRDNGSADDSLALAQTLADTHRDRFYAVEVEAGSNIGFGAGQNRNVDRALADWVLVLNPDCELEHECLGTLLDFAARDTDDTAAWELRQKPFEHPKYYDPVSLETTWCSGAAVLFRRSAFNEAGGFDERFFLYGEDVDLSWRLKAKGYRLRYLPWICCQHHSHEKPGELKTAQAKGSIAANILLRLRFGRYLEIAWIPVLIAMLFIRGRRPLKRHQIALTAISALRQAPRFLASRSAYRGEFQALGLDYGWRRTGAFHATPSPPADRPLVSIVVRTMKGRRARLNEALWSLIHQTWPALEIVVIEDGSNESESLCQSLDGTRGRRILYDSIPASGRCRAGNAGLALCNGDFLGFLDDDDLLFADHIELLADGLVRNEAFVAAFSPAAEEIIEIDDAEHWTFRVYRRLVHWQTRFNRALLQYLNFLPIQSVLFRRELFDQHGGFDENLELLEDWELWARYSQAGDFLGLDKLSSVFRTPANNEQRMEREQALYDAQKTIRASNIERCRKQGHDAVADLVDELADHESGPRRWQPLVAGIIRKLPGGRSVYEYLLRLRRKRLIQLIEDRSSATP